MSGVFNAPTLPAVAGGLCMQHQAKGPPMNEAATSARLPESGPPASEPIYITWQGSPWSLAWLGLFNFLLTLVTLGVYSFWGRTEVRKRLWSMIRINGEPLEYTGTGKELFLGFLVVFAIVILPFILVITAAQIWLGPIFGALALISFYIVIGYLFGVGLYRARRYRLSRTRWRGIRGTLVGSDWGYAWGYFWTGLVSIFTGGWLHPWRTNYLYRRMTNDMRFGDRPFKYDGKAGPLYPAFAMAWVGGIIAYIGIFAGIFGYMYLKGMMPMPQDDGTMSQPTPPGILDNLTMVGIVIAMVILFSLFAGWYFARVQNVLTAGTQYEGLRFVANAKGPGMIWVFVSNYLLTVLTLGILKPVADARMINYLVDHMAADGILDLAAVAQSQAAMEKRGEGLASAFDLDAIG